MTNQDITEHQQTEHQQFEHQQTEDEDKETARTYVAASIELYSDNDDYVAEAVYRIGKMIGKIRDDRKWNNATLLEYLSLDHFPSVETISRLINHTAKRNPSAAQLFDLRRVFGISLDALADGGEPFVFEQMSDARLVEMMEAISSELGRRIRQQ